MTIMPASHDSHVIGGQVPMRSTMESSEMEQNCCLPMLKPQYQRSQSLLERCANQ